MSSGGLTRRRGGGRAGDDNGDGSRVSSPVPTRNGSAYDSRVPETSFADSANGHKIAFDPRDISENEERTKQPKLNLMEEVLLLGLKDKQVRNHRFLLFTAYCRLEAACLFVCFYLFIYIFFLRGI